MNMYVMIMNENAWTCMRMYENDSCSREGWVILGWVALYDIHDNEWECTRMTENDWERLTYKENGWGGGHSMRICTLYDMHETEWEFLRLSHNEWTCMWWYGMTMHGNVWYWLIFKVTWPVGSVAATNGSSTSHSDTKMPTPGQHAPTRFVMKRHDHAWECMILTHIQGVSGSFTAESHSPTCMMNVSEWLVLRGCAGHSKQIYMWRVA